MKVRKRKERKNEHQSVSKGASQRENITTGTGSNNGQIWRPLTSQKTSEKATIEHKLFHELRLVSSAPVLSHDR
jgi:hypothetical protein